MKILNSTKTLLNVKKQQIFLVSECVHHFRKMGAKPKIGEGVPICYRLSLEPRLKCANQLGRGQQCGRQCTNPAYHNNACPCCHGMGRGAAMNWKSGKK